MSYERPWTTQNPFASKGFLASVAARQHLRQWIARRFTGETGISDIARILTLCNYLGCSSDYSPQAAPVTLWLQSPRARARVRVSMLPRLNLSA